MAIINPPSYEFPTIDFNSSYFTLANTGFTQAQATKLFLQKTVADSASATETFNAGINTDSIQSVGNPILYSAAATLAISGASTVTTVNGSLLSTNSSLAIADNSTSVPTTNWSQNFWAYVKTQANTWTQINTFSNSVISPIFNYTGIMNVGNSASTLNIGTQTNRTSGIHIGDGNTNTTGVVHIANGTSNNVSNAVRIMDGSGSSGGIIIGGVGTTTTLNGTVNIIGQQVNTFPITLGSLASTTAQLGGTPAITNLSVTSLAATTTTNLYSFTLPAGIWLVYGGVSSGLVASTSYILLSFSSVSATVNVGFQSQTQTSTTLNLANALTCPIYVSSPLTYYLVGRAGVTTNISNLSCYVYRIG